MGVIALEQALPTFAEGWHVDAFVQAQMIATLLADGESAERMRPTLLRHARKLVAELQGDIPAASGNVLRFVRKSK